MAIRVLEDWMVDVTRGIIVKRYADELYGVYYRWWTCKAWNEPLSHGLKIGPITMYWYEWDGPQYGVTVAARFLFDTGIRQHRRPR